MTRTLICMKWGQLYGPEYVNVLYRAARDHIDGPVRMICLTDDETGLLPEISCRPIPDLGLTWKMWARGGWPKLALFSRELADIEGRCLFLDLDVMIVGPLDDLFDQPAKLSMILEWPRFADLTRPSADRGCSAVLAYDIAQQHHVLDRFLNDPAAALAAHRQEQQFLQSHGDGVGFFPSEWMVSFKRILMAPPILDRVVAPKPIPEDARMIIFHGSPRPSDVVPNQGQRWGKGWHYGRGAVPYVRDYWLRYGNGEPG